MGVFLPSVKVTFVAIINPEHITPLDWTKEQITYAYISVNIFELRLKHIGN